MAGILCIVGFLLAGRLGWIQIARGSQYEEMAMNQTEGVQTLYSPRGTIYDTNGKELAFSIMVKSLYADPGTMNVSAAEAAKDLAPILKKNESDLAKAMSRKTRFVWLERLMDPEDSDKVQALIKEKGWKGFGFFDESRRFYPNGPMAANVLGFVGLDDKGLDGLEMSLDDLIRGGKSKQMLLTDARGNPILESALAPYKAENERSVYLTIDQNIQFYAERALDRAMTSTKASGGIIIVMDPKTGAILALGNRPSYDPNHLTRRQKQNSRTVPLSIFTNQDRHSSLSLQRLLWQPKHMTRSVSGTIPGQSGHPAMPSGTGMMNPMAMSVSLIS